MRFFFQIFTKKPPYFILSTVIRLVVSPVAAATAFTMASRTAGESAPLADNNRPPVGRRFCLPHQGRLHTVFPRNQDCLLPQVLAVTGFVCLKARDFRGLPREKHPDGTCPRHLRQDLLQRRLHGLLPDLSGRLSGHLRLFLSAGQAHQEDAAQQNQRGSPALFEKGPDFLPIYCHCCRASGIPSSVFRMYVRLSLCSRV